MNAPDRTWRPLGFLLLMIGFGLRLDTPYQAVAWLFVLAGGGAAGAGLFRLSQRRRENAFVPPPGKG
jgi:hypothetical protein